MIWWAVFQLIHLRPANRKLAFERSVEVVEGSSIRTTIFLGYTSNLVSSGLRETLRYLVEHKHVSAIGKKPCPGA